jgi:hypothetical protein
MRSIILCTSFAILCGISAAVAQTSNANSTPSMTGSISAPAANTTANLRQQVQQNLSKAGFSDIKIMPESFLIRAKDPSGNPVMMVINPDSIAAVTLEGGNTSNPKGSNKAATNPGNSGSGR